MIMNPENEPKPRKLAIIVSKGNLDDAYPALVLANAARMTGIDATLFFTMWGMDVINRKTVDDLHASVVGNPSMRIPTMVKGLPGMEHLATKMMTREMKKLDLPSVPEFLEILEASGAELYACKMALDMFKLKEEDLVPQVKGVLSAMDFFEMTEGAQIIFI